ncbi:MAG: hypothetical protein WDZ52_11110 [Pseudohongiellaceae bacterium]
MRISWLSLLAIFCISPAVGADENRDANRLLRASNVASQFETMTLEQTRKIIRTYSSIVAMSADVDLPQWLKREIAACYERTFAWENFEEGIAQIFLENFSRKEMQLLTDFYRSEGLPPTEIENFKTAIAKGNRIQQLSADYIYANSEGCAEHDIDLILGFLADTSQEPNSNLAAE